MSAKKSQEASSSSPVGAVFRLLVRLFQGETRPVALGVLIVVLFVGFWYVVWQQVGDEVLTSQDYWVKLENLEVTPLPPWIEKGFRAEGYRDASLGGPLSIMDPNLTERIAKAFALHPWVAKVCRVQKCHPGRVKVDLVYRRPVCIVLSPSGPHPVDAEGVVLPIKDFSLVELSNYPHLVGIGTLPVGPKGTRWGDPRVVGGAEVAAVLGEVWKDLGLERIAPCATVDQVPADEPQFELYTRSGTRIIWGRAPGTRVPDEVPASIKLARLKDYRATFGSLDGARGAQPLDVRSMRSMQTSR